MNVTVGTKFLCGLRFPIVYQQVNRTLRYHKKSPSFPHQKCMEEALIFPVFYYAAVVAHALLELEELKLQRLQNAYVRYVYRNIPYIAHVTPYRFTLGWIYPALIWNYLLMIITFGIVCSDRPQSLANCLRLVSKTSQRISARVLHPTFYYTAAKSAFLDRSFQMGAPCLINALTSPLPVFSPVNNNTFKWLVFSTLL